MKERIIKYIQNYFSKNQLGGVVVGISGGKDSAVVAGLFTEALGKENVVGIAMPCQSIQKDMEDAKIISDYFGFKLLNIDLEDTYHTFLKQINKLGNFEEKDLLNSNINLKPRLRMATLYYMAALLSATNKKNYIVAGTGNKCEIYVGYYTKGGDGTSDINVLANLTVSEVIKLGEELQVPKEILYKTPSDGLSGISDEEKLGVSYQEIETYLKKEPLREEISNKIAALHKKNLHKLKIETYNPSEDEII